MGCGLRWAKTIGIHYILQVYIISHVLGLFHSILFSGSLSLLLHKLYKCSPNFSLVSLYSLLMVSSTLTQLLSPYITEPHPYAWPLPFLKKAHSHFHRMSHRYLNLKCLKPTCHCLSWASLPRSLNHISSNILFPGSQSSNLRAVFDYFLCISFLSYMNFHSSLSLCRLWIYHFSWIL